MKRFVLAIAAITLAFSARAAYGDHRGHNLDSLERVVAGWTPEKEAAASYDECRALANAYGELMMGYRQINGDRAMLFARKLYNIGKRWGVPAQMVDGLGNIALQFYGREQYDSALVYFGKALEITDLMAAGEKSPSMTEPYRESDIDSQQSFLYGSIGNTYNLMGDIPTAMEYYRKAGEIFDKYGWNESNAILWYNMGETWMEENEPADALPCYRTALKYAEASGDSLQLSMAYKGLGRYYMETGKASKALRYIKEADSYYSLHEDQEFMARIETLGFMNQILDSQKNLWRGLTWGALGLALLLVALGLLLRRNRKLSEEKEGADAVIEQALAETTSSEELTDRELQILPLVAAGLTSPQIADKLCLSLPTIKWYRKRLLEKFGAQNTAELVSKAKEKGLV